jgi:hypothetical protein
MRRIPPLLPEEAFARVLRLARFDGLGVLFVAGLFAILSALAGDRAGAIIGLLIAGAGAIELHGATLLVHGQSRGMRWLVISQLYLMVTILGYCEYRVLNVDLSLLRAAVTSEMKAQITSVGWTVDEFVQFAYRLTWFVLAVVTVLYQGGMAIYYVRRRKAVARALHDEPVV